MDVIEHRVRERAYYIWEGEGRVHGRADAHWLRAEAEIAAPAAILTIEAVAETSLAPSPAKTLKPRASRAKAVAQPVAKPAAEAKPAASKTAASKPAASKTAASKTVTPKAAASKVAAPKAPKALAAAGLAAKPKSARAATGASLH